ncbi:MAG: DUF6777 domain-containing protein [Anaerolineae bacterium]
MQPQSRSSLPTLLLSALLLLGLGGAGTWYYLKQADKGTTTAPGETFEGLTLAPGEIFLQPAAEVGPDPFAATPLAPPPDPTLAAPVVVEKAAVKPPAQAAIQASSGAQPGLYGGSRNDAACNVPQLVSFLGSNAEKAAAWVAALNADPTLRFAGGPLTTQSIPAFVNTLTPIVLLADTRVTNHGFVKGQATPRQDVLQKGTAVLVDPYGVPRARCFCGNPLLSPQPSTVAITYVGRSWADFDPAKISVVSPAPQPQVSFQVKDASGTVVQVTVGSPGLPASSPAAGGLTPAAGASPATTSVSATAPVTGTAAAGAAPVGAPYSVQPSTSPDGRISMAHPAGWETENFWSWIDIGGQRAIYQQYSASPSRAVSKDKATTYTIPEVAVKQVWPATPGQALDVNAVIANGKSTLCSNTSSPQPVSHPKFGAGILVTDSNCGGNPSAAREMMTFGQPDGSVVQIYSKVLEPRDRDLNKAALDSLTLPKISAPAAIAPKPQCSKSPPGAPPVDISVVNTTAEPLRVVWHDYNCKLDIANYQWIVAPGETEPIPGTYEGSAYTAVAVDGSTVGTYTVPASGGTWTLP